MSVQIALVVLSEICGQIFQRIFYHCVLSLIEEKVNNSDVPKKFLVVYSKINFKKTTFWLRPVRKECRL